MAGQQDTSANRIVDIWNRRKWLAAVVFIIVLSLVGSVCTFLPDAYRSTVTLLVESQQVPSDFVRSTVTSGVERRVQTIAQAVLGRERLEGLIREFSLYQDLKSTYSSEEIIERMRRNITLDTKTFERGGTNVTVAFMITYIGDDPRKVASVANTLASYFIEEDLKTRERQAGGTSEFLRSQIDEMKKKLDAQEQEVSRFKERHIGELPDQQQSNLATLERMNSQLLLSSEKQMRAREQKALLERQLGAAGGSMSRPTARGAKIAKLTQELADLRRRFSDKYPDVVRAREELERLRSQPEDAPVGDNDTDTGAVSPYILQLQQSIKSADGEIRMLSAEEANLRRSIVAYQGRVENAPRREQEFQELSRDYNTTKEVYASLLKRYEEAKIAESMEYRQKGEQFRILDSAVPALHPNAPDRTRLMLMCLALALGAMFAAMAVAEKFDNSFHDLDDLRAFSRVPVLASIPRIITKADADARRRRMRLGAVSTMAAVAVIMVSSYFIARNNQTLVALAVKIGGTTGR
jgi:polysaccharide biosynthesis transport protein